MIERYQTIEMKKIFTESARFDYMLIVEKAVSSVLAKYKMIPKAAYLDIQKKSKIDLQKIYAFEAETKHDVIAFVNQVAESIGTNGKYFHFGLTSSDVLDTAMSLQTRDAFEILSAEIKKLKTVLKKIAKKHSETICAGRTHGIFAEITTFGFKLMGFLSELSRCEKRIFLAKKQFEICKLSGAVGTSSALGHQIEIDVAKKIKLNPEPFATQVIPRDRHAEVFMSLAFLASHLERLAIELRHLQRTEVSEVIEGFSLKQKGSSAMPHKKNPISAENITGLCRLIKGYAWTAMENIPLWHERDISHSSNERIIFGDAFTATHYCLKRMNLLLENIYIDTDQMLDNTYKNGGLLYSSHLLNHLIQNHKMDRNQAYQLIQTATFKLKADEKLENVILSSPQLKKYFSNQIVRDIFSGKKHLTAIKNRIKKYEKSI